MRIDDDLPHLAHAETRADPLPGLGLVGTPKQQTLRRAREQHPLGRRGGDRRHAPAFRSDLLPFHRRDRKRHGGNRHQEEKHSFAHFDSHLYALDASPLNDGERAIR